MDTAMRKTDRTLLKVFNSGLKDALAAYSSLSPAAQQQIDGALILVRAAHGRVQSVLKATAPSVAPPKEPKS